MKVPSSWSIETLEDCVDKFIDYRGKSPNKTDDGILLITAKTVRNGYLDFSDPEYISVGEYDSWMSRGMPMPGDILFTTEAPLGNVAEFPSKGRYALAQRIITLRGKNGLLDNRFLKQYLLSSSGQRQVDLRSTGSTAKGIKQSTLRTVPIKRPPLPEQQKIADILGTWDEALEKLDALIAAKARRKQALMQQLLTGHRRLPGFDKSKGHTVKNRHGAYPADWSRVKLGDVTTESSVRADTTAGGIVLSCTKHHGLVPSEEYFGKRVYAADTSAYKVARRGEFAYATNHIEEGSIGYQNLCDIGLVSPIYTVFKTKDAVDDAYFYRLLKSSLMIHLYRVNTSASVDRRGSLRYGEFAEIKVNLPKIPEQRAIAAVLDTADAELRLLRQQRTAIDHQKRGLMQQLLTGAIRVAL